MMGVLMVEMAAVGVAAKGVAAADEEVIAEEVAVVMPQKSAKEMA